jgi:hypothetical protein
LSILKVVPSKRPNFSDFELKLYILCAQFNLR